MRTAIACQYCRRSKIKCHHDGVAPCRACTSAPRTDCLLSGPIIKNRLRQVNSEEADGGPAGGTPGTHDASPARPPAHAPRPAKRPRLEGPGSPVSPVQDGSLVVSAIALPNLPAPALLLQASNLLQSLFPEFGFLHRPSFTDELLEGRVEPMRLHAILSVTARFVPTLVSQHGGPEAAGGFYAARAETAVMLRVLDSPDVGTIQSLLLVALHHWGACNGSRAWMLAGIAVRMTQAMMPKLDEPNKLRDASPGGAGSNAAHRTSQECIRRTIWAASVVDCLLSGGKHRPQSFQAARLDLSMPVGEDDFAFQTEPDKPPPHLLRLALSTSEEMTVARKRDDCDNSLLLIIKGMDIWSTLSSWICAGGRQLEPVDAQSSPWNEGSFWSRMKKALDRWYSSMSDKLHYSPSGNNLQAHIAHGQGQQFVFVNLIFHLNQLFLHREYIPFLPHRCASPVGPIDPPLLVDQPPDGWWVANSNILFQSATCIVDLLRAASKRGVELRTVFVAFCMYSAASTLLYAQAWPYMAPNTEMRQEDLRWAMDWLEDTGTLWKIVQGWKQTLSTVSAIYESVKADASRFPHLGRHGLEDLEDRINRFAEIPPSGTDADSTTPGGEHAAATLLDLSRHSRPLDAVDGRALRRTGGELNGRQWPGSEGQHHEYGFDDYDTNASLDPDLLASIMDGSMADMLQIPLGDY
ncbi:Uu.00g106980.m01.CDS01 [Anthostomella pinea]|uniref:Uu.00g106980.m01.CDS01 n=1 Tax=Anthostomella pinea TaxID=933095 RepID=A0AAI8VER2_9PEZI|nr:Uu.00g106980.m01.CDS01 [Anthostomella pinea]